MRVAAKKKKKKKNSFGLTTRSQCGISNDISVTSETTELQSQESAYTAPVNETITG